jgi:hypothetical protein
MKKTITRPDGTTEVVEGTAEEIAEYEKKIKVGDIRETPKKGPGLLTEESLARLLSSNCSPNCVKCSGGVWMGVVPPPCVCVGFCWGKKEAVRYSEIICSNETSIGRSN